MRQTGRAHLITVLGEPGIHQGTYATFLQAKELVTLRSFESMARARDLLALCVAEDPTFELNIKTLRMDRGLDTACREAVTFIVNAQDKNGGGWRYYPGQAGDTTVTGWMLMALKSGQLSYMPIPPDVPVFDVSPGEMFFTSLERWFCESPGMLPYENPLEYGSRLAGVVVKYQAEAARAAEVLGGPGISRGPVGCRECGRPAGRQGGPS